jgi:hypothetical protein
MGAFERAVKLFAGKKVRHQRVRVPVADLMLRFKQAHQLHVLQVASCLQNPGPVRNRLPVGFLDGGEVGGGAFRFWGFWHGWFFERGDLEDQAGAIAGVDIAGSSGGYVAM